VIHAPGTGRPSELDGPTARWLAWHEAMSHAMVGREVRQLGDGVLLYDPNDREPFWNRIAGLALPSDDERFDRRLTEMLALFASLDRVPHFWPMPGFDEPPDLAERLLSAGFVDEGAGMLMALDPDRVNMRSGRGDEPETPDVTVERVHRIAGPVANDAAYGIAIVLAEAFGIEPYRIRAIEAETLVMLGREDFHAVLVRVDGEPAATARRSTFAGASYLSSIGTRPRFQGRGLGRLASAAAIHDAIEARSRWTYLGVFDDNVVARRLYEDLGFVALGGPSPDLLLR
jgi:ribosomal protein S18 acetylase RimI-like enzyme